MPISMHDQFVVRAPIEDVWAFLLDPHRVARCMPGAHLQHVEPDGSVLASIKIGLGPFHTSYKGRVVFAEVDESRHWAHLTAEGHESGGGDARGSMVSSLTSVDGGTQVVVDVTVDGASKLVKMGLNFSEHLAHELFEQFVTRAREQMESPAGGDVPHAHAPVQIVPLLGRAFMRRFRSKD